MADDEVPSGSFGEYDEANSQAATHPDNYEICQRSNFRFPAGTLVKQWDGLWVAPKYLDFRHPQDFLSTRPEVPNPPRSPEPDNTFIEVLYPNEVQASDL